MLLTAVLLEESMALNLPSLKILTGIAVVSLLFWKIFAADGQKAISALRKLLLSSFLFFFIFPYYYIAAYIKNLLIVDYDLNYLMSESFHEMRGTDWADGILTAAFLFIYIYMAVSFWKKNANLDEKKPEDKPFKFDVTVGNSKDEKK